MIHLTKDLVIQELEKCVQQRGEDYIYPPSIDPDGSLCYNWHPEERAPGCIVGQMFYNLGVPGDILNEYRTLDAAQLVSGLQNAEFVARVGCESDAISILKVVQLYQDAGSPWGEAVANAKNREES